jgi:hypothetical protein
MQMVRYTITMKTSLTTSVLCLIIIILLAVIISPYLVTRTSTAQQTDMPPGMAMKSFYIGPLRAIATSSMPMDMSTGEMPDMPMPSTSIATTTAIPAGILASTTAPVPTVSFAIVKDALDGWDLHIDTTNFTWTPQLINQAPIADQGHAHLYIDGELTVLFGPWYHIDGSALPPGKHIITVSLNANDHSIFVADGHNIQSTQTLIVRPF